MTKGRIELPRLERPFSKRVETAGSARVQVDLQPVGIRGRGLELERHQGHAEQTRRFFVGQRAGRGIARSHRVVDRAVDRPPMRPV